MTLMRYLCWFFACLVWVSGLAIAAEPNGGVVVEKVGKTSALYKAGVLPGDLLFTWERMAEPPANQKGAQGQFKNVFYWRIFLIEQTPRGRINLYGERDGKSCFFEVPMGDWQAVQVRPIMPKRFLSHFYKGKDFIQSGKISKGITEWEKLILNDASKLNDRQDLKCWIRLQIGKYWAEIGHWDKANYAHDLALELVDGPWSRICVLGVIATAHQMQNQLENAKEIYLKMAEIWKSNKGEGLGFAKTIDLVGYLSHRQGAFSLAEKYYLLALKIRKNMAPNSVDVAGSLLSLGNIAIERGNYKLGYEYYLRALSITESLAPDSIGMAMSLNNLGIVAHRQGNLDAAISYYKRALSITKNLVPGSIEVSISLQNLGIVAISRGDLDAAEKYFRQSLDITENSTPDKLDSATSFYHLGIVAISRGDSDAAGEYFKQSLDITESLAPGGPDIVDSLSGLGIFNRTQGDLDAAENFFKHALSIQEKLSPGSTDEARLHNELANIYRQMKKDGEAGNHFKRSIQSLEAQLVKLGGSDHVKAGFQGQLKDFYLDYIDFLLSENKPETAFDVLERARARVLHRMISERDFILSGHDIPQELEQDRRLITHRIEKIQQKLVSLDLYRDTIRIEKLKDQLFNLRREYDILIEKIRKSSPRYANLRAPKPLNLAEVKEILDPGTLMFSYCVTEEKTFLFLVQKDRLTFHVVEKGELYLRDQVQMLHSVIKDPESVHGGEIMKVLSSELFNILITPAISEINSAKRLLIIPDGPLQKLPFSLLREKIGDETRYLIEWKPITTIVSATIYAELKKRKTRSNSLIAAFGDPLYPQKTTGDALLVQVVSLDRSLTAKGYGDQALRGFLSDNPNDLKHLPYTAEEVQFISRTFPGQTRVYLREEANEKNVKALGKDPSIIHLACHGWANDRYPLESTLAFTLGNEFNEGKENGILQAWEIFGSMRINADLLVLSACETGLGKVEGTEGLTGLTRAFQFAGARSIIASYWNVDDQSTSVLMRRFYQYLKWGKPKAEALRQAQVDLIHQPLQIEVTLLFGLLKKRVYRNVSHPYFWAAFQFIGPWD